MEIGGGGGGVDSTWADQPCYNYNLVLKIPGFVLLSPPPVPATAERCLSSLQLE